MKIEIAVQVCGIEISEIIGVVLRNVWIALELSHDRTIFTFYQSVIFATSRA